MPPIQIAFLSLDPLRPKPTTLPQEGIPLFLRIDLFIQDSHVIKPTDVSHLLEWEKDFFIHSNKWDLSACPRLEHKQDIIEQLAEIDPFRLAYANPSNLVVMKACVKRYGLLLACADPILQDNKELVLLAINERASSVQYASLRLKQDPDVILKALTQDGLTLALFPENITNQKEFAKHAIMQNGLSLKYVKGDLNDDYELVLLACTKIGFALQFASERLKKNEKIVLAAVTADGNVKQWCESVEEVRPGSRQALHFMSLRSLHRMQDLLFVDRLKFRQFLASPTKMPLEFADISLQNNGPLKDISEITSRTLQNYGTTTLLRAAKRARYEPVVSETLSPIMPIERAALGTLSSTFTPRLEEAHDFIGPNPGIDLKDFIKPRHAIAKISYAELSSKSALSGGGASLEHSIAIDPMLQPAFSFVSSKPELSFSLATSASSFSCGSIQAKKAPSDLVYLRIKGK